MYIKTIYAFCEAQFVSTVEVHKKFSVPFETLTGNHHHLGIALVDSSQCHMVSLGLSLFRVARFSFLIVAVRLNQFVGIVVDFAKNDEFD